MECGICSVAEWSYSRQCSSIVRSTCWRNWSEHHWPACQCVHCHCSLLWSIQAVSAQQQVVTTTTTTTTTAAAAAATATITKLKSQIEMVTKIGSARARYRMLCKYDCMMRKPICFLYHYPWLFCRYYAFSTIFKVHMLTSGLADLWVWTGETVSGTNGGQQSIIRYSRRNNGQFRFDSAWNCNNNKTVSYLCALRT